MIWIYITIAILLYIFGGHFVSYYLIKNRVLKRQKWDLNICCGKTDGKGINADIVKHKKVHNFVKIKDIYNLPFKDKQFDNVLCSHTIEHVDDPKKFYKELKRVGRNVVLLIPPLWDTPSAIWIFEHKWIFLSFKSEHKTLPKYIKMPLASFVHKHFGQMNCP